MNVNEHFVEEHEMNAADVQFNTTVRLDVVSLGVDVCVFVQLGAVSHILQLYHSLVVHSQHLENISQLQSLDITVI